MLFWLGFYLFFFLLSTYIGYQKGNLVAGILLGYVLGPIGVICIYLSKDRKHMICQSCNSKIHVKSYFCPQCKTKQLYVA